jgi:hypothetical protein
MEPWRHRESSRDRALQTSSVVLITRGREGVAPRRRTLAAAACGSAAVSGADRIRLGFQVPTEFSFYMSLVSWATGLIV